MSSLVGSREWVDGALSQWTVRGWLRHLDLAFARFVADVAPAADGAVLLAAALVAHLEGQGHPCLDLRELRAAPAALFGWEDDGLDALAHVIERVALAEESLANCAIVARAENPATPEGAEPLVLDGDRLYLRRFWRCERRIVAQVLSRAARASDVDEAKARAAVDRWFGASTEPDEPDWQRVGAAAAMRRPFTILTGGPGTGKTFTAARILALAFALDSEPARLRIALAAPTGKAAARLKQSIDDALADLAERSDDPAALAAFAARVGKARTLHRLLGARRGSRCFRHDASHPLDLDLLIVDEASMIDVELMDAMLDALPPAASLVLLGDQDQLASVEAGAVLGELCRDARNGRYAPATADALQRMSGQTLPAAVRDPEAPPVAQCVVALRRSHRFGTVIGDLARAVQDGDPGGARTLMRSGDASVGWLVSGTPDIVVDLACGRDGEVGYRAYVDALARRPTSLFAEDHDTWVGEVLRAFDRFRVLCALREGPWGVAGLNRAIEQRLRSETRAVDGPWYAGRPVIVTRNDPDAGVFNGDVGVALPATDGRLRVHFRAGPDARAVGTSRLADVQTAYAMTVHKAQGSEFAHVALVLPPETARVTTRELLYTGITRARERFTLVTSREASLDEAVAQTTRRSSGIAAMLARADGS